MKPLIALLALCLAAPAGAATNFKHVIIVVQENRTPDNLFHELLNWKGINPANYDLVPNSAVGPNCKSPQALALNATVDAKTCTWTGTSQTKVCLAPGTLPAPFDPDHSHCGFAKMFDGGKMDGASMTAANNQAFGFVQNNTHVLDPYLQIAADYGFANRMFQTNQGPSFPAHQYLFGATSAETEQDDDDATFVSENPGNKAIQGGYQHCLSDNAQTNSLIQGQPAGSCPAGCKCYNNGTVKECGFTNTNHQLCFNHDTLATLLDNKKLSWKYYSPDPGSIWTAPLSINAVCQPNYATGTCDGPQATNNLDYNLADVVADISDPTCSKLANVSWVIPTFKCSDHAKATGPGGPAWVASIINAVGKSACWKDTAVIVTWDDWGGWWDHVPPPATTGKQGDYQLGFRVPLLVVSNKTPKGFVSNNLLHFGSIVRWVEENFGLPIGKLGADGRGTNTLDEFFQGTPRAFAPINAPAPPVECAPSRCPTGQHYCGSKGCIPNGTPCINPTCSPPNHWCGPDEGCVPQTMQCY